MNSRQRDEQLALLWTRCSGSGASKEDWEALYRLVSNVLIKCKAPELAGLPDERRVWVETFFADKIYLAMKPGSRPYHCGALTVFFRN